MVKKFFFSVMFCAISMMTMAQTQSVTHVVQRGETIESIAKNYNVSVEDINKANPNADGMFYAGMKLAIPVSDGRSVKDDKISIQKEYVKSENFTQNETLQKEKAKESDKIVSPRVTEQDEKNGGWHAAIELGYGFLEGSRNYMYEITGGANYMWNNNIYAGARVGYNSARYSSSKGGFDAHFVEIPLEVGYGVLTKNKQFGFAPFASICGNISVSAKSKVGSGTHAVEIKAENAGGKICMDAKFGIRVMLAGFTITGSYHFPINKNQKRFFGEDSYPEISIGGFVW